MTYKNLIIQIALDLRPNQKNILSKVAERAYAPAEKMRVK